MSQSEQNELDKYLEAKAKEAKQEEDNAQESQPLSAYEACVLKESARVRALMEGARNKHGKHDLN
ncbi:hypothetical protein [Psychrobacter ciconiae]|uniref:hypothetical protein n=1 Tax=Psychrobacter ciconiae TaxID=1553449 RepID=UPI00191B494E|nr:hypothetical protein [Psychrobacter ciconiae]